MEEFFIITREGVYRHEILGVFDKRYKAELYADEIANAEHDQYHDIEVSSAPLNVIIENAERVSRFSKGSKPQFFKTQTSSESHS